MKIGANSVVYAPQQQSTDALRRRGVDFVIANLKLDTTTAEGYYIYTIMSANSEFERRILSRRTREGLAAARLQGKRLGRPRKLTQRQVEHARERLNACECSKTALAKELKVGRWTLARALRRQAEAERPN